MPLDLFELYRRGLQLTGINSVALDAVGGARILTALAPLFERGELAPTQAIERYALSAAATAYARVAAGSPAKIVLVPDARL